MGVCIRIHHLQRAPSTQAGEFLQVRPAVLDAVTNTPIYSSIDRYIYTSICTHMSIDLYLCIYVSIYLHIYVCIYLSIYLSIYLYMGVCIRIHHLQRAPSTQAGEFLQVGPAILDAVTPLHPLSAQDGQLFEV